MLFSTVGAPCWGEQAAVKNGLEVAPAGARRIGAAVFQFRMLEGAPRTCWTLCFPESFDVAILRALLALSNGGGRVGFLDGLSIAIEINGWEHSLDGIRFDVANRRIGTFFHDGWMVRVEEAGC